MADGFHIDAAWLDALDRYVEGLYQDTQEAAQVGAHLLTDSAISMARDHPDWVSMADNIEAWSQDGKLVLGVMDDAMVSEAFALEYGDENRPPSPMIRKFQSLVPQVQARIQQELLARRGMFIPGMQT